MAAVNRREFLGLIGTAAAVAPMLDLDKLLWVPGKKTIFLPDAPKIVAPFNNWMGPVWLGTAGESLLSGDVVRPDSRGFWKRVLPGETHPIVGYVAENLVSRGQPVLVHEAHYISPAQARRTPLWAAIKGAQPGPA